jgi:phosphoribosylaminoimidazolecarboxamide formyltransferase/IMP cyclohydrolase
MDNIQVKTAFIAVFDKKNLDNLVPVLKNLKTKVIGTAGTVKYLKTKGINAKSAVSGFDFDGRVKSLDRKNFAAILADSSKKNHLSQLAKLQGRPVEAVIVDLYKPDKKGFPESMDIGGQALIRAAIKNFKSVAVAFDKKSIEDLAWELKTNKGQTNLAFRKKQAGKALKFIAGRAKLEAGIFS